MNYSIRPISYRLTGFSFEDITSYTSSRYNGLHLMIEKDIEKLIKKEMISISSKKYLSSNKRKQNIKKYYNKPEVKEREKKRLKKYRQRPEVKEHQKKYGKEYHKKYWQRPENKIKRREQTALHQENRSLTHGNVLLMTNPFPPDIKVEYHHLLNDFYNDDSYLWFMIPIPKVTHQYVGGASSDREHWRYNALWIKRLFGIDVKELLEGKIV